MPDQAQPVSFAQLEVNVLQRGDDAARGVDATARAAFGVPNSTISARPDGEFDPGMLDFDRNHCECLDMRFSPQIRCTDSVTRAPLPRGLFNTNKRNGHD